MAIWLSKSNLFDILKKTGQLGSGHYLWAVVFCSFGSVLNFCLSSLTVCTQICPPLQLCALKFNPSSSNFCTQILCSPQLCALKSPLLNSVHSNFVPPPSFSETSISLFMLHSVPGRYHLVTPHWHDIIISWVRRMYSRVVSLLCEFGHW